MIDRLLSRLHKVFNKDPQAVPVITLNVPDGTVEVKDGKLTILSPNKAITIYLAGKTMAELEAEINSLWTSGPYFAAPGYLDPNYLVAQE